MKDLTSSMYDTQQSLLSRIDADSQQQNDGQQALHEELLAQVDQLSVATHTKIEDLSQRTDAQARCGALPNAVQEGQDTFIYRFFLAAS